MIFAGDFSGGVWSRPGFAAQPLKRVCWRLFFLVKAPVYGLWLSLAILPAIAGETAHASVSLDVLLHSLKTAKPGPFASQEIPVPGYGRLSQWRDLIARMDLTTASRSACPYGIPLCRGTSREVWFELRKHLAEKSEAEILFLVNRLINRRPYVSDVKAYRRSEYWATPDEFTYNSGDCEDYAIAKYFALRALGFALERLRIVVVRDRSRPLLHAVLTVRLGEQFMVLDSLHNEVFADYRYAHYQAIASVNEHQGWKNHRVASIRIPKARSRGRAPQISPAHRSAVLTPKRDRTDKHNRPSP